jgi:hypothetical protein
MPDPRPGTLGRQFDLSAELRVRRLNVINVTDDPTRAPHGWRSARAGAWIGG